MSPDFDPAKPPPEDLKSFGQKLKKARKSEESRRVWKSDLKQPPKSALGLAFRVSVELVSALAVGMAIGWGLDYLLGTKPWLMVVFLFMGFIAGVLNVYRMASGFGNAVGYDRNEARGVNKADAAPEEEEDRGG